MEVVFWWNDIARLWDFFVMAVWDCYAGELRFGVQPPFAKGGQSPRGDRGIFSLRKVCYCGEVL
jgi:hypothetical protein